MMSEELSLNNVIKTVKKVVKDELQELHNDYLKTEIVIDSRDCFRIIIEWEYCMVEILAEKADFSPYRFVRLSKGSFINDDVEFWYDKPNDSLSTIESEIQRIILMASQENEKVMSQKLTD